MHLNRQLLCGKISKRPELRYNAKGTAYCSLTLAVDKPSAAGQVFTSWHQVEIIGRFAEDLSVSLDIGDEILVEGEHQYRSLIDPKTAEKKKWCVLSTWGVSQKISGPQGDDSPAGEPNAVSEEPAVHLEAPEPVPGHKTRKRAIPAHLKQPWTPQGLISEN